MRTLLRDNGLTLFFAALLLLALVGQSVAGLLEFNSQQTAQGLDVVSYLQYLTTSDFAVDVAENWQSEFLQFSLYIFATVWLVQRGSTESKEPGSAGPESDEDQQVGRHAGPDSPPWARAGGLRLALFSRSLGLAMGTIFLLSWLAQSIAGRAAHNGQQLSEYEDPVSWLGYVGSSDFWSRSLQNWQSEFLARRGHGGPVDLPAAARLVGVQAGGQPAPHHRRGGLRVPSAIPMTASSAAGRRVVDSPDPPVGCLARDRRPRPVPGSPPRSDPACCDILARTARAA